MLDNMTLYIDPVSRDLEFDGDGSFRKIYGYDTVVQNVRHTLSTWKDEFFADPTHGTDYERIMGLNQNEVDEDEVKEIIREAVFQEPSVSWIDSISVAMGEGRMLIVTLSATMEDGSKFDLEVKV